MKNYKKKFVEPELVNKLKLTHRKKEQMVTSIITETPQINPKKRKLIPENDADPFSRRSTQIEFGWFKKTVKQDDVEKPKEEVIEPETPKLKKSKLDLPKHDFEMDINFSLLHSESKPIKKFFRPLNNTLYSNKRIISINEYIQNL